MPSRWFVVGLAIVIGLGAWLRVHRLSAEGVWLDEACSVMIAQQPLPDLVAETAVDVHPPLYYVALRYWMGIAGTSEAAVRALSVLFGLIGIGAAAVLTRRLFGPGTGLIAAAILAASPFHLLHSQQARMYTLLALMATLSMHGFVAMLQRRPPRAASTAYVAATVLLLYTHVYGLFIVAAQHLYVAAVWLAARHRVTRFLRHWVRVHAIVAVAFVPWAIVLAQQLVRVDEGFWIGRWPGWLLPYTLVVQAGSWPLAAVVVPLALVAGAVALRGPARSCEVLRGPTRSYEVLRGPTRSYEVLRGPTRSYEVLRMASSVLRWATRDQWRVLLLALWLACPVVLPFVLSEIVTPIFLPKYTLLSAIALAILAARGLVLLRAVRLQLVAAPLIAWFAITSIDGYYARTRNDRWREAVVAFDQAVATGDLVLFSQPWGQIPFDYYQTRRDITERTLPANLATIPRPEIADILDAAVFGHDRAWFVLSQAGPLGSIVEDLLAPHFVLRQQKTLRGVELYLFERSASQARR